MSLCPSSSNCRWNSMMVSLRRMVQESTWSAIMTLLAQARIEANDTASTPPLVMVKREQVIDILGLLEPFQEALQVKIKLIIIGLYIDHSQEFPNLSVFLVAFLLITNKKANQNRMMNPVMLQH